MANISELNLTDEETQEVTHDDLPPQGSGAPTPLPRPGTHKFQLPQDMSAIFETVDTDLGQRIQAVFIDEHALTVLDLGGSPFRAYISSAERMRGKEKKLVSDLTYLLVALDDTSAPRKSTEFIKALTSHAGEQFRADVEWKAHCSEKKDIYIKGKGKQEGKKGCGQSYAMREYEGKNGKTIEIPRNADGTWAEEFTCGTEGCNATIRCNGQLTNFRNIK